MLNRSAITRPIFGIILLALLFGAIGFWASIQGFYFFFLVPVLLGLGFYATVNTEKFILLTGAIAPLSININDIGGGLGLALPTEPIIIVLCGFLVFRFFQKGTLDIQVLKHPLSLAILAYIVWLWLSCITSTMPLVSFKYVIARTWYIIVFYFTLLGIFKSFSNIHFFYKAFSIFTLILVIYTLGKHAADGFVRSSSYSISWPFFPDHGMYAAAIAFAAPLLAFYAFNGRAFNFNFLWLPVAGFFLIVLLFGIVVSYTRATWLSLVLAMGVFVLIKLKIKFYWIVIALVSIFTYTIVNQDKILYNLESNKQGSSDELEGHVKSVGNITTDPSNMERINRWKCAGRMVDKHPLFGFGPGTFAFQYGVYQKSSELTIISTNTGDVGGAHSEFLLAMAEAGYPALLFWTLILLFSVQTAMKVIYNSKNRQIRITALMALLGLVTYYTHALLNEYSQYDKVAVPMWGFLAVIVALDLYFSETKKQNTTPQPVT